MPLSSKKRGWVVAGVGLLLVIVLLFVKFETDKQGAFLCEVVAEDPNLDLSQCPAHESPVSWLIMFAFGVSVIVLAAGLYMALTPLAGAPSAKVDVSRLDEDEKTVYELLKKSEGSMYQSDIMKETGFSKVHITRVLDKLETRKVLERKRRGMTNIVVLR